MSNQAFSKIWIVIIIVILIIGGFFAWQYWKMPREETQEEKFENTQDYLRMGVDFTFKYPLDWEIKKQFFYKPTEKETLIPVAIAAIEEKLVPAIIIGEKEEKDPKNWIEINTPWPGAEKVVTRDNISIRTESQNHVVLDAFDTVAKSTRIIESSETKPLEEWWAIRSATYGYEIRFPRYRTAEKRFEGGWIVNQGNTEGDFVEFTEINKGEKYLGLDKGSVDFAISITPTEKLSIQEHLQEMEIPFTVEEKVKVDDLEAIRRQEIWTMDTDVEFPVISTYFFKNGFVYQLAMKFLRYGPDYTTYEIQPYDLEVNNKIISTFKFIEIKEGVTLLSPNGGEKWKIGDANTISWEGGESINISAQLIPKEKNGTQGWIFSTGIPGGSMEWDTKTAYGTRSGGGGKITIQPGEYKIKIGNGDFDESDDWFSITGIAEEEESITVISPNGGEELAGGTRAAIMWTGEGLEDESISIFLQSYDQNGDIIYLREEWKEDPAGLYYVIADWISASVKDLAHLGSEEYGTLWFIPEDINKRFKKTPTYFKIIITERTRMGIKDESDDWFRISGEGAEEVEEESITIISPNGGEEWAGGTRIEITWTGKGLKDKSVAIYLHGYDRDGKKIYLKEKYWPAPGVIRSYYPITEEISATTKLAHLSPDEYGDLWFIPEDLNAKFEKVPTYYKIWIGLKGVHPAVVDESDDWFSITGITEEREYISVISPNGGEKWEAGKTHTIKWKAKGLEKIDIKLKDYKYTQPQLISIASGVSASSGEYSWHIPIGGLTGIPEGEKYKIFISEPNGLPYAVTPDESDDYFSIVEPIKITSPKLRNEWTIGENNTIQWQSSLTPEIGDSYVTLMKGENQVGYIAGVISSNDPITWDTKTVWHSRAGTEGSFEVEPGIYQIEVTIGSMSAKSFSFEILASEKSVTVISPNGGEKWMIGNTYDITWESVGVEEIDILLRSYDADYQVLPIQPYQDVFVHGIEAKNGSYTWYIPTDKGLETLSYYKVTIEEHGGEIIDESDGYFSIVEKS